MKRATQITKAQKNVIILKFHKRAKQIVTPQKPQLKSPILMHQRNLLLPGLTHHILSNRNPFAFAILRQPEDSEEQDDKTHDNPKPIVNAKTTWYE